jgi:hypothetical protein
VIDHTFDTPFIDEDGNVDARAQPAIDEIQQAILRRWPDVTFSIHRGPDNPNGIHMDVFVDQEDPDVVLEGLTDRLVDILVDDGIPLHVIPLHTPERALAAVIAYENRYHRLKDVLAAREAEQTTTTSTSTP